MACENICQIPRPEHPRPDFMRETFFNLNGEWQFAYDDANAGMNAGWYKPGFQLDKTIIVPFCYQSKMSGIGPTDEIHPVLWYRRSFTVPAEMQGQRILLRFGAVDFKATVFVNGQQVGSHVGGYTPFAMDITHALVEGENDLCVRVEDEPDCTQPRGKQYWDRGLMGCWYTPSSGIWQTVYLEAIGSNALTRVHVTPDYDRRLATVELALERMPKGEVDVELNVTFEGKPWRKIISSANDRSINIVVDMMPKGDLDPFYAWTPDTPNLYDLKVTVRENGEVLDTVSTYFGMRKVELKDGKIYMNNSPLYQRLILDQGYWPDSLITPPSDEAIQLDVKYTLAFGYNGARKHQKIEDPRYYYWADKLGLLTWGELPSPYIYTEDTLRNLGSMMNEFIERDFNHPSIICWVPLNESWGTRQIATDARQQASGRMLYHMTKAQDGTRLCSTNDGWEQVESDLCAIHDYAPSGSIMEKRFADKDQLMKHAADWRAAYCSTTTPTGKEAMLVTEYGGIAFMNLGLQGNMGGVETWGYGDKETDEDAFFARFQAVTDAIREIPYCQGYCYTQLTDVMQEINGLLTPDRQPKVNVKRFRALNGCPEHMTNQMTTFVVVKDVDFEETRQ